ncbi:hypothetical protein [Chiayiivirga flava]|uniref:Uncharacterized protein n=1 Tax=Chiayiivirga flava TaxID=659595 RepID=A0A7W8D5M0_9GAMM|nr:hypothetical protein [Chiayiivirga flava]MBB5207151.1 hypothetical protein [Chiayiivirga flava]
MRSILLASLLLFAAPAFAAWPLPIGGQGDDAVVVTKMAPNGDVFAAGHFQGSITLGNDTLVSRGLQDVFVVRVNAAGQVLWARSGGGPLTETITDIALDNANNVYLVGAFFGSAQFGGDTLTANGSLDDAYVTKLDVQGGWRWARRMGGVSRDIANAVVPVPGDNTLVPPIPDSVVVAGTYRCQMDFPNFAPAASLPALTSGHCAGDATDMFAARISGTGEWLWAIDRGPDASGGDTATAAVVSGTRNILVTGQRVEGGVSTTINADFASGDFQGFITSNPLFGAPAIDAFGESWGVPRWFLALRGGPVTLTSPTVSNAGATRVNVSVVVRRGYYATAFPGFQYSEFPDASNEFLALEYYGSDGAWHTIDTFPGGGQANELFDRTGANAYQLTDPLALHANFQVRLRLNDASGIYTDAWGILQYFDWWHVGALRVEKLGSSAPYLMPITNVLDPTPQRGPTTGLPRALETADIALNAAGNRMLVTGTRRGPVSGLCPDAANITGAFFASLTVFGSNVTCDWVKYVDGGAGRGITTDPAGRVYATGSFQDSVAFNQDADGTLEADGEDIFIAAFEPNGTWDWVTGGSGTVGANGLPAYAGGGGNDAGLSIAANSFGTLYVGGRFEAVANFGPVDTLAAADAADGFLVNLGTDGRFFQEEKWIAGVPLVPPPNAELTQVAFQPDFAIGGVPFDAIGQKIFTWAPPIAGINGGKARLIPLQPVGSIEVRWRVAGRPLEDPARVSTLGAVGWPTQPCGPLDAQNCYQSHVIGAPVEAEPASGNYKVLELVNPNSGSSDAVYSGGTFTAARSGTSVLVYVRGPALDILQYPIEVEIVRTVPYAAAPLFVDNVAVEIGKKIVDPHHNEPNRTGFVVNALAYYDGSGTDAAYNRTSRTGAIIPVNRYSNARAAEQGRELVVAWYHDKARGVYWPEKSVRYVPHWPYDPDRIVIASEQGGEGLGQQPLLPAQFTNARIYIQNDFGAAGFNPNDEHAFMAPSSTGTGFDSVFALRSDFGNAIANDQAAASDPYVLLKYLAPGSSEWKFRVYKVLATGAGYNQFRYAGTAGTTVSPPYPVRLLPGCGDTFAVGQALGEQPPPPFFQDYKNQLWAKSAGSGAVKYFYPAQPGFFTDLDNNNLNDIDSGTCVPWLARLPVAQGGSVSLLDPIEVHYDIVWPDTAPLLISGETLLTPKRGLPDIYNQAAVEVVYDAIQDEEADPAPSDTLAQLLDPLNPRSVRLAQLPETIASNFETDGSISIAGSADGVIKLPVSISQRISYDPLNRTLDLVGAFDETGAGEPFLLLNVLSKRDRVALKTIDGGDGSEASDFTGTCDAPGCTWDQAVEALFRQSRNPQGITKICPTSEVNTETRVRTCTVTPRAVTADDVLIGFQDDNDDGILEPFQAVGVSPALSAGLSQGSGFMTVAFNNDPSLNPLPVSLEVIRVGCLESDATNPPINSTYQGQINVISPANIFDEQLVLRHSGDFGGNPDALEFEWFFHPDANGTPPMPLPDPATGQLNGWIQFPVDDPQGALEISIEGANIQTLSDNWYLARYRGLPGCNNTTNWSLWAGQPGATPINQRAQLAEGWVKRVLGRLNPFEARVQDFGASETNNYASMLIQLGERYSGPVALNADPDNLNSIGLIEAYTTVMRRALQLSADSTPPVDYGPANAAVLLVASRLVDFYTLLGNEGYADAQDPTIAIDSADGTFTLSPSIFTFQNQLESPLEEELVLLRGRDDSGGPVAASPVYNRLFWNFTTGDGEVAYALSYNIADQDVNGVLNEFDARIMFPQGHGDAWGHYLTATTIYYNLLRHPFFSWNPQSEAVLVAGVPINVDFLDERQFAVSAAAKARTGAEIVDLTYRSEYVEDPNGQWQGYEDTDPERAWGLSEWGRRAGMGAYFDWVTVNAIVPAVDPDPSHVGIQKIERRTVSELDEIASHYTGVQRQVDKADAGLNPLGLAKGVVPFDIDPTQLTRFNKTQFEQIWERAMGAVNNALKVWDFANQLNNQLRRTQDSADELWDVSIDQETDFANQLIEIFGYPYADDIGPTGVYPAGYDGPDLYHYMYVDVPVLSGTAFDFDGGITGDLGVKKVKTFTGAYKPAPNGVNYFNIEPSDVGADPVGGDCAQTPFATGCPMGDIDATASLEVEYTTIESPDYGLWFTKPESWTGERRAPGRIQQILQQMLEGRVALKQALLEYDKMRLDLEAQIATVQQTFDTSLANINVSVAQRNELRNLTIATEVMKSASIVARRVALFLDATFENTSECVPDNLIVGLAGGGDIFSVPQCTVDIAGDTAAFVVDTVADGLDIVSNSTDAAKEDVGELAGIRSAINDANLELYGLSGEVDAILRSEPLLRSEIFARTEALKQLRGEYLATLAEALRIYDQMLVFRRSGSAATQEARYRDMAFRIFRNDALQKYRASFDLAARYVFLAASAYDYETNLLGGDGQAGQKFLTQIVKERGIGQIIQGVPQPGSPGLADTMAQLKLNFDVLKGQMGFNNPQVETNRFSLRRELFRIPDTEDGDAEWRAKLDSMRVPDLWKIPEFRRYARPFAPESAGPQPGIVIEFDTNVTFGLNFFGWALGPQDSSYDSSKFATRIRSVGAWFGNYASLPLADDPNIYLLPVGADVLRAPDANDFRVREWSVVDQAVPIPFPISSQDLDRFDWNPATDTLSESSTQIRRYPQMRAHHFSEPFDDAQVTAESRLVGRSVWNRRWMIIIPGGTFLNDPVEGLDTFIHGRTIPGGSGTRDGNGVDDIRIFFKTYAYSGS